MTDVLPFVIGLFILASFAGLCVRVNAILQELKRQGDQRAADAKRIIALLEALTNHQTGR